MADLDAPDVERAKKPVRRMVNLGDGLGSVEIPAPIHGYNSTAVPADLNPFECILARNLELNLDGVPHSTNGYASYSPSAGDFIKSLFDGAIFTAGAMVAFVQRHDNSYKIYWLDHEASTTTDITPASFGGASGLDQGMIKFVNMNNLIIGFQTGNGGNLIKATAAATQMVALGGSPPACLQGAVYKGYLFITRSSANTNRVYYSDVNNPESYPAANYFDVPVPADGDPVMALDVSYAGLIIYKRRSVYLLSGSDPTTFVLTQINSPSGLVYPFAVCHGHWDNYFIGDRGLYRVTRAHVMLSHLLIVEYISPQVEADYNAVMSVNNLTSSGPNIMLVHDGYRGRVWALLPGLLTQLVTITAIGPPATQTAQDGFIIHDYSHPNENNHPSCWQQSIFGNNITVDTVPLTNVTCAAQYYTAGTWGLSGLPLGTPTIIVGRYNGSINHLGNLAPILLAIPAGAYTGTTLPLSTLTTGLFPIGDDQSTKHPRFLRFQGLAPASQYATVTFAWGATNTKGATPVLSGTATLTPDSRLLLPASGGVSIRGKYVAFQFISAPVGGQGNPASVFEFQGAWLDYVGLGRRA